MAEESDRVELVVNGAVFAGWQDMSITMAMDAACGTYGLSVTDRWTPKSEPWVIEPQDLADLKIGGQVVVSGFVDIVRPRYSALDHTIEIQGRDKASDLVDCSAIHKPDQWKNITLTQFAQILCKPFAIKVTTLVDVGAPFALIKLQQGESSFEALNRCAKMRKILVMADGKGGILLTRTGTERALVELVQGKNILNAGGSLDVSGRFSEYIVKGQGQFGSGGPESESHVFASVKDAGIKRYRPMLIVSDTETNGATAKERATWAANTRIGQGTSADIEVQGWRQTKGGPLWAPNLLVRVRSPWLRLDGEMLIRQVTLNKSLTGGTTATLSVVPPQTFEPEPPDGKQKKKLKRGRRGKASPWSEALGEDDNDD